MRAQAGSDPGAARRADSAPQGDAPDGLVVFDGLCGFCSAGVRAVLRADRVGAIRFTPLQSPYGRALARRYGIDAEDPSTFLFFDRGRPLEQSEAAIALARRLPRPWRWLSVAAVLPRRPRDAVYGFVARNRYRIAGRSEACMVPSLGERARFVEEVPSSPGSSSVKRPE